MYSRKYLPCSVSFILNIVVMFIIIGTAFSQERSGNAEITAIRAGKIIDGVGDSPLDKIVILISGERILDVGTDVRIPSNANVIDLSGYTVLPGSETSGCNHGSLNYRGTHESHRACAAYRSSSTRNTCGFPL